LLDSYQNSNSANQVSSSSRPIITHLDFSAQLSQPTPAQVNSLSITELPITRFPRKTTNPSIRKSPYNTRPPKKPSLALLDENLTHSSLIKNKRTITFDLSTPSKKGPGSSLKLNTLSITVQEPSLDFSTGSSEKQPARALFKAARKGKKKLVSVVVAAEDVTNLQGAALSLPSIYEAFILELQRAFQASCSSISQGADSFTSP
jgi:hypothetical protein